MISSKEGEIRTERHNRAVCMSREGCVKRWHVTCKSRPGTLGKAYCQHLDLELSALRTVKKKLLMVTQGSGPVTLKIYMTDVGSALKGILETLLYRRVQNSHIFTY